ncbi:hypothetical protein B0H16DRAFT_1481604 [Mycena metata]|uniref:Uncharacterized protein n=1 Tax=Mycena metata TaxID=1033252 RepID=A0AAD7M9Q7_9AGAR|nr:hypothetical protein B0H16DRAFT_1481604 [Mycena metata]
MTLIIILTKPQSRQVTAALLDRVGVYGKRTELRVQPLLNSDKRTTLCMTSRASNNTRTIHGGFGGIRYRVEFGGVMGENGASDVQTLSCAWAELCLKVEMMPQASGLLACLVATVESRGIVSELLHGGQFLAPGALLQGNGWPNFGPVTPARNVDKEDELSQMDDTPPSRSEAAAEVEVRAYTILNELQWEPGRWITKKVRAEKAPRECG